MCACVTTSISTNTDNNGTVFENIYIYIFIYISTNLQGENIKIVLLRSGCSFGTRLPLRQHTTSRPAIYTYTYTCSYICMVNTQKNTNQKRDMSHNLPESHMKTRAIASRPSPTATTRWYGNAKQISNANVRVSVVCACMCPCVRWMRICLPSHAQRIVQRHEDKSETRE